MYGVFYCHPYFYVLIWVCSWLTCSAFLLCSRIENVLIMHWLLICLVYLSSFLYSKRFSLCIRSWVLCFLIMGFVLLDNEVICWFYLSSFLYLFFFLFLIRFGAWRFEDMGSMDIYVKLPNLGFFPIFSFLCKQ